MGCVMIGWNNLPPLIELGLADLQILGGCANPLAPGSAIIEVDL